MTTAYHVTKWIYVILSVYFSGENLYIDFIVDDRKQRQGFAASFTFIKEDQLVPVKTKPTSYPHIPNGGGKIIFYFPFRAIFKYTGF